MFKSFSCQFLCSKIKLTSVSSDVGGVCVLAKIILVLVMTQSYSLVRITDHYEITTKLETT